MPNPTPVTANSKSGSFTSGTSVAVSSTGSVVAGDLMVVVLTVGGASAPSALSPPDGTWTTFLSTTANTGSGLIVSAVFYKRNTATGAFSGNFTWTTTATSGSWGFLDINQPGALLVDGSVITSQNASGTKTSPSITPGAGNVNDTLIGCIIGAVVGTDTITQPAGMTSLINIAGLSTQPFFSIASLGLASASATGTKTWTIPTSRTCLGLSFLIQQGPTWGWDDAGSSSRYTTLPNKNLTRQHYAATKGKSEFAIYSTLPYMDWQAQPPQPPKYPTINQAAATMRGDDGTQAAKLNWFNTGWEIIPVQPPHPFPEKRSAGALAIHDDGNQLPKINFYPTGFESVLYQPNHPRPERWASLARGDDGTENKFIPPPPANVGWGFDPFIPFLMQRSTINQRYTATKGTSGFAFFQNFYPTGFESILHYLPHPKPERSGAVARGDDGTAARFTNFYPSGYESILYQPNHPRPEKFGALAHGDDGTEAVFIPPVNTTVVGWGFDAQPTQPRFKFNKLLPQRDSIDSIFVQWFNVGWEIQSVQPPHTHFERGGPLVRSEDGIEFIKINFYPTGFESTLHQPNHPKPERFGALVRGDDGTENTYVGPPVVTTSWGFDPTLPFFLTQPKRSQRYAATKGKAEFAIFPNFYPTGFEIAAPFFRHLRLGPAGIMRGGDGTEAPFIPPVAPPTPNAGWEIPTTQLRFYTTIKQRASGASGQSVFAAFSTAPWTDDLAGFWRYKRPILHPIVGALEAKFVPPSVPSTSGWGFDPTMPDLKNQPRLSQRYTASRGTSGFAFFKNFYPSGFEPIVPVYITQPGVQRRYPGIKFKSEFAIYANFYPVGFESVLYQPNHPRPERSGSIMLGDIGIEAPFIPPAPPGFQPWGYEPIPIYSRFLAPRAGSIMVGDTGIEGKYVGFFPSGWEVQPYQPNAYRAKQSGIMRGDDGIEGTKINWFNTGWEIIPVQPPHPWTSKKFAAVARGDEGTQGTKINFLSYGWPVQPWQPPHPRPERAGAIMPREDGIEAVYVFVPPPVITYTPIVKFIGNMGNFMNR